MTTRSTTFCNSLQSDTEAYFGRVGKAREFSQRATDSALHADAKETAALWQVNAALRESEFGNADSARRVAGAALALTPGRAIRTAASLSLARASDALEAKRLADSVNKDFPQDTIIQGYWLPMIRAAIELDAGNPVKAVELLKAAAPYELGQCEPFLVEQRIRTTSSFRRMGIGGIILSSGVGPAIQPRINRELRLNSSKTQMGVHRVVAAVRLKHDLSSA